MRKSVSYIFIFLISSMLSGFAVREENPNQTEQKEIDYFQNKEYMGDKEIYTEVDLYPPYFKEGEAKTEDILRYLRLLRNEIFARSGYIFESEDLKEFFVEMDWYKAESIDVELNQKEKENIIRIKNEESRRKDITGDIRTDEIKEERNYKKILLRGTFYLEGTKESPSPKEFAMTMWEGDPDYPSGFTISKDGKTAYLLDTFNNQLKIFDLETRKLIKNIHVLTYCRATPEEIERAKKILNKEFLLPTETVSIKRIFWDDAHENLYLAGIENPILKESKPLLYTYDKKRGKIENISETIVEKEEFLEKESKGLLGFTNAINIHKNGEKYRISVKYNEGEQRTLVCENKKKREISLPFSLKVATEFFTDKDENVLLITLPNVPTRWNPGDIGKIIKFDPLTEKVFAEEDIDLWNILSNFDIDKFGNIYYWERIPKQNSPYLYESKGWQVVKLEITKS